MKEKKWYDDLKPEDFQVRIVRDTRFPPVSHKLTLPERVKIIEERQRILKEEREHAKSARD